MEPIEIFVMSVCFIGFALILYFGIENSIKIAKLKRKERAIYPAVAVAYRKDTDQWNIIAKMNRERLTKGMKGIHPEKYATELAFHRNTEMIRLNLLSHQESHDEFRELIGLGADNVGENIAFGYASSRGAMRAWLNSEGHKANILYAPYNWCGVSVVTDPKGQKWYCVIFIEEND